MRRALISCLILLLGFVGRRSHADDWGVKIEKLTQDKPAGTLPWTTSHKWVWSKNPEGAMVLKSVYTVTAGEDLSSLQLRLSDPNAKMKVKGSRMAVSTGAQILRVYYGSSTNGFEIDLQTPNQNVIDEGCAAVRLRLMPKNGSPAPFFLGARCESKNEEVGVHITFPSDSELVQSSLFETLGKGESYRVYDLKKINAADSELGHFEFSYQGKTYAYSLMSLRGKSDSKKARESHFAAALGWISTSLAGDGASDSYSAPFLQLAALPVEFFGHLGGGANLETAISLSSTPKSISYLQFEPYAFYRLKVTPTFSVDPRLYYVIVNEQHQDSGIGFTSTQLGLGLSLRYQITKTKNLALLYMTESIGAKVIKAHSDIELNLATQNPNRWWNWGAGLKAQSYSVVDSNNLKSKFAQTIVYGQFLF